MSNTVNLLFHLLADTEKLHEKRSLHQEILALAYLAPANLAMARPVPASALRHPVAKLRWS